MENPVTWSADWPTPADENSAKGLPSPFETQRNVGRGVTNCLDPLLKAVVPGICQAFFMPQNTIDLGGWIQGILSTSTDTRILLGCSRSLAVASSEWPLLPQE